MKCPPKECVYCGATEQLTRDHVPPLAIFAKPRPSNLITVPACSQCHTALSMDDEYFRRVLTLKDDTYRHPDVQGNLSAVMRSFTKPAKAKFNRRFFDQLSSYEVRTPAGLYLGTRVGFNVDLPRLERVAARIIRGLYCHESGTRLSTSARVRAFSDDSLRDSPDAVKQLLVYALPPLRSVEPRVFGDGTFVYCHHLFQDLPEASTWLLQFYGKVQFLCITVPTDRSERARNSQEPRE